MQSPMFQLDPNRARFFIAAAWLNIPVEMGALEGSFDVA